MKKNIFQKTENVTHRGVFSVKSLIINANVFHFRVTYVTFSCNMCNIFTFKNK